MGFSGSKAVQIFRNVPRRRIQWASACASNGYR
jgi:hypothetical protein